MRSTFLFLLPLLFLLTSTPSLAQWRTPPAWQPSPEISLGQERGHLPHHASAAIDLQHRPRRGWAEQWVRIVVPAATGAAIGGLAGGFTGGYLMDEGLNAGYAVSMMGVVGGWGVGSVLGSAGAATLLGTSEYPVSFTKAAAGAAVGFIPAYLLVAIVAGQPSALGTFALFGLAQGAIVALFASYPSATAVP